MTTENFKTDLDHGKDAPQLFGLRFSLIQFPRLYKLSPAAQPYSFESMEDMNTDNCYLGVDY